MKITNPILSTFHLSSNGRNPLLRGDQWAYQSWLDIRSPWLPHLSYLLAASLLTILPIPEFMSTTFTRPLGSWWTPMDQNLRVSCLGSFLAVNKADSLSRVRSRQTDWLIDKLTKWVTEKLADCQTDLLIDSQTDWQTDRLKYRQTDYLTNRWTHWLTD